MTYYFARPENVACDVEHTILSAAQTSCSWHPFTHGRQTKASPKTKRIHLYIGIFRSLLVYSLAIWGFINTVQRLSVAYRLHTKVFTAPSHRLEGCDCGDSIAEAMLLGCKFDALSMAWLPEHCRDDELTAEFDTTGKGKKLHLETGSHSHTDHFIQAQMEPGSTTRILNIRSNWT